MKVNDIRTERRILAAAEQLLAAGGVRGWNMDRLALEAGLSKNTLYKVVGSKESLLTRLALTHIQAVQTRLNTVLSGQTPYAKRLREAALLFPELLASPLTDALTDCFREYPALEETVLAQRDALLGHIAGFLRVGVAQGDLRADTDVALLLLLLQTLVLATVKRPNGIARKKQELRVCLGYLLDGVIRRDPPTA